MTSIAGESPRLDLSTPCDLWAGRLDHGYGRQGRTWVHRAAYEAAYGPVPPGRYVGHACHDAAAQAWECRGGVTCQHRRCVNPLHLRAETPRESTLGSPVSIAGRNARKTHCPAGHYLAGDNLARLSAGGRSCLQCRRDHYAANRETGTARARAYYAAHRDARLAYDRARRAAARAAWA